MGCLSALFAILRMFGFPIRRRSWIIWQGGSSIGFPIVAASAAYAFIAGDQKKGRYSWRLPRRGSGQEALRINRGWTTIGRLRGDGLVVADVNGLAQSAQRGRGRKENQEHQELETSLDAFKSKLANAPEGSRL